MKDEFIENCHVCLRPIAGKDAKLDHCHKTGHCRGWLCHRCNYVLGAVKDDVDVLRQLIRYLEKDRSDHPMAIPYSQEARNLLIQRNSVTFG